jgi:hypothetical protein
MSCVSMFTVSRQCHLVFEPTRGIRREGPKLRMDSESLYVFVVGEPGFALREAGRARREQLAAGGKATLERPRRR